MDAEVPHDAAVDGRGEPGPCEAQALRDAIRAADLSESLAVLSEIAAANGGDRAAGAPGGLASVEHVVETLATVGLEAHRDPFAWDAFVLQSEPTLEVTAPESVVFVEGSDYEVASYSSGGDVTGDLVPVDVALGPGNQSTSGCESADFSNVEPGAVALLQLGGCDIGTKIGNAQAAAASAAIVFNQGDLPGHDGLVTIVMGQFAPSEIPILSVPYALGAELAEQDARESVEVHIDVDAVLEPREDENVVVDIRGEDPSIVLVGAHLDTVPRAPGMNDNGSGAVALLSMAFALSSCVPPHTVRFGWWNSEEAGLVGSIEYARQLRDEDELPNIVAYVNVDMIGSINGRRAFFANHERLRSALSTAFGDLDLDVLEVEAEMNSDHVPFWLLGVPTGGVETGASEAMTVEDAVLFGGEAGAPHDPCYHQSCDGLDNVDVSEVENNARAILLAILGIQA